MPENDSNQDNMFGTFVEKLMADKGVSAEEQAVLRPRLTETVERRVEQAMVAALKDDDLARLDQRLDAGMSDEELEEFFAGLGIDFNAVVARALQQFWTEYLDKNERPVANEQEVAEEE